MTKASMGRKRKRTTSSAQLLAMTAFAIVPLSPQGFLSFTPISRGSDQYCDRKISTRAASSQPLRAFPRRDGHRDSDDQDDPDDPLPRTMEELYRQMRSEPPRKEKPFEPDERDLEIFKEVVSDVFGPTEEDSWWEENGEEWDRLVSDSPELHFGVTLDQAVNGKKQVWQMQSYFGEGSTEWEPSGEDTVPFSLSAYKAGTPMGGEIRREEGLGVGVDVGEDAAGWFKQTPFAEYWEALPDLRTTKRVYAFNAVDRMAALKFMMNITHNNGMHGPADSQQAGHFLWGYADQLDWMRRSGRLSTTPGSIKIDRDSWWGRVGYALTIVPLAAAVESGLWEGESVSILGGEDLQLPEMRRAVRAWRRVWSFDDSDIATRLLLNAPVHDALQERVRRAQWAAHLKSLEAVEALYGKEFDALPSNAERDFARGWCRAARLFSEAAAHTNADCLLRPLGAGYPPERILSDRDVCAENVVEESLESVPYGPPHLVAEAENDPAVALNTRRCVESVQWLGALRAPSFAGLRFLWRRACVSYPARRKAARVLRSACYGGKRARASAWGKSFLFLFVPNLNYRKLTLPLGVDPAESIELDPDVDFSDPARLPPRPPGSRPLNPLQWPWYDGRRPDPSMAGWDEDDDGLCDPVGGMFPPGRVSMGSTPS